MSPGGSGGSSSPGDAPQVLGGHGGWTARALLSPARTRHVISGPFTPRTARVSSHPSAGGPQRPRTRVPVVAGGVSPSMRDKASPRLPQNPL